MILDPSGGDSFFFISKTEQDFFYFKKTTTTNRQNFLPKKEPNRFLILLPKATKKKYLSFNREGKINKAKY